MPPSTMAREKDIDLMIGCRLVGWSGRALEEGQKLRVFLTAWRYMQIEAEYIGESDIGGNIKCRFFKVRHSCGNSVPEDANEDANGEGGVSMRQNTNKNMKTNINKVEWDLHICFNWFSPPTLVQSIYQSVSLFSCNSLCPEMDIYDYYVQKAVQLFEKSEDVLQNCPFHLSVTEGRPPEAVEEGADKCQTNDQICLREKQAQKMNQKTELLQNIKSQNDCNNESLSEISHSEKCEKKGGKIDASENREKKRIILTGFSQGAAIAHSFLFQLLDKFQPANPVTIYGLGPVRFCGPRYADWYRAKLMARAINRSSLNLILAIDPTSGDAASKAAQNSRELVYDPVCVMNLSDDRTVMQPNCYVFGAGGMRRCLEGDEEKMKKVEPLLKHTFTSVFFNIATRFSPSSDLYEKHYKLVHSVLLYYQYLTA